MKKLLALKLGVLVLSLLTFAEPLGNVAYAVNNEYQIDQAIEVGIYIVENDATQTNAAAFFDVTEMTIRNYIYRLQTINPLLYQQVREIVAQNRSKHRYRLRRI